MHTALPYKVDPNFPADIQDSKNRGIGSVFPSYAAGEEWTISGPVAAQEEAEHRETAEFIVKACNNHYALVAALEGALDSLEYVKRNYPDLTGWGVRAQRISEIKKLLEEVK